MKKIFGTDGVRGLANKYPMTPETALALGQAAAHFFKRFGTERIVIGKDTRRSSYMLELALASGVCSMGCDAIFLGPIPTPGVAYLTKAMRADAGIMISASHNPYEDNGVKFFGPEGYKLTDQDEIEIENFIFEKLQEAERPTGSKVGKAYRIDDALGRYIEYAKKAVPKDLSLEGYKIVLDCANGAGYKCAPQTLWELKADVKTINNKPDGTNINDQCGAMHPEELAQEVRRSGAHIGIALDGDADRVILIDECGRVVDGDQVLAMCALNLHESDELRHNTFVGTVMTNQGVVDYLAEQGIKTVRTPVGDRYIIEKMREHGFNLGGEPSGHIIFGDFTTTGDGLVAGLQVLALMKKKALPLSELVKMIPLYPQEKVNLKLPRRVDLDSIPAIKSCFAKWDDTLKGKGRFLVRYSGTESVLRLMVEGKDSALIKNCLQELAQTIESHAR